MLLRFECHEFSSRDVAPLANKLVVIPDLKLLTVGKCALAASLFNASLLDLALGVLVVNEDLLDVCDVLHLLFAQGNREWLL